MKKAYVVKEMRWFEGWYRTDELYTNKIFTNINKALEFMMSIPELEKENYKFIHTVKDRIDYLVGINGVEYSEFEGEDYETKNNYFWKDSHCPWYYIDVVEIQ